MEYASAQLIAVTQLSNAGARAAAIANAYDHMHTTGREFHVESDESTHIISMRKADGDETDLYYQNVGYF